MCPLSTSSSWLLSIVMFIIHACHCLRPPAGTPVDRLSSQAWGPFSCLCLSKSTFSGPSNLLTVTMSTRLRCPVRLSCLLFLPLFALPPRTPKVSGGGTTGDRPIYLAILIKMSIKLTSGLLLGTSLLVSSRGLVLRPSWWSQHLMSSGRPGVAPPLDGVDSKRSSTSRVPTVAIRPCTSSPTPCPVPALQDQFRARSLYGSLLRGLEC